MTLVIGYADSDIGFLVGDTLLSHEHFRINGDVGPVNGEFHCLKIQILTGSIAVAFAGPYDRAYECVRSLNVALAQHETPDPIEWLSSRNNVDDCEFLVLFVDEQMKRRLVHVSAGRHFDAHRYYIGMQSEYDRYLCFRRPYVGPLTRTALPDGYVFTVTEGEKEFEIVGSAIEALSRDNVGVRHKTVGAISGSVIRVVDARISKQLEYMQSVEVSRWPWEPEGGYSLLASNEETRGIGIYFRGGEMGFMMPVCEDTPCIAVRSKSLADFIDKGNERFGMKLEGGTW